MAIMRAVYTLAVREGFEQQLHDAWRTIVRAHQGAEHGAVESFLLRHPEEPGRWLAVSRWRSAAHHAAHQNEDAHPDAYARFEEACEVLDAVFYEEVEVICIAQAT